MQKDSKYNGKEFCLLEVNFLLLTVSSNDDFFSKVDSFASFLKVKIDLLNNSIFQNKIKSYF